MPDIKAHLKYLRIAPRKVRLVADAIRGREVNEAERILKFLPKRASRPLVKLLTSALADAKHNFHIGKSSLYIKSIRVDAGPMLKRYMARARGRASIIRKRTSHVSMILDEV